MNPGEHSSFLLNWTFWAVLIAGIALLLSQLPPLRILFRKTRIRVDLYDRVAITHWLGNPSLELHLLITNDGGAEVMVQSLNLTLRPDEGTAFTLPGQTYQRPGEGQATLLFTGFVVKPDEKWGNFIKFFSQFNMADERLSKQLTKDLRKDIQEKIEAQPEDPSVKKKLVEAEPRLVQPLQEFYTQHNKWRAGEYTAELRVICNPERASSLRRFRFTLFESDILELGDVTSRYKHGDGVYWFGPETNLIFARMKDLE